MNFSRAKIPVIIFVTETVYSSPNSRYGFGSFRYYGSKLWNALPAEVKKPENLHHFKKHITQWCASAKSDQHMTWNAYIREISYKISISLGIMNRLKRYLPQNISRTIYHSLILSHINYSILVWKFKFSRISKLQKRGELLSTDDLMK